MLGPGAPSKKAVILQREERAQGQGAKRTVSLLGCWLGAMSRGWRTAHVCTFLILSPTVELFLKQLTGVLTETK